MKTKRKVTVREIRHYKVIKPPREDLCAAEKREYMEKMEEGILSHVLVRYLNAAKLTAEDIDFTLNLRAISFGTKDYENIKKSVHPTSLAKENFYSHDPTVRDSHFRIDEKALEYFPSTADDAYLVEEGEW